MRSQVAVHKVTRFVAWADGDGNKGKVQNKLCYILQNKNQKIIAGRGAADPPGPLVDTPLYNKIFLRYSSLSVARSLSIFLKSFISVAPKASKKWQRRN